MSGHNKWSSIKHKKGAADAKRGKIFTKLIKEISIAAKNGGADPLMNPRLRTAIAAAKEVNMPNDNITRAIKKGTGELDGGMSFEEVTYEGYGPGGTAILVEAMTDNKNRTVSELRHIFTRAGGNMGETGSVNWMFKKKGAIYISKGATTEDALMEIALDSGAEDVVLEGDSFTIYTDPNSFENVRAAIEKKGIKIESAELTMISQTKVKLTGAEAEAMIRFIEKLEDYDDVQKVHANFDIDDAEMDKLAAAASE
ncbi:MAG: YebC/PmpR family DNA-binding transcriptional regulator [Proteobacteria bacterium]|nr:YebC/PmpR family DNA-binding transcriptional regulator [Pseudomonadota bacterium]